MNIQELARKTLEERVKPITGEIVLGEGMDDRPAIEHILESLASKAATGDAGAAKELREWLKLGTEKGRPKRRGSAGGKV